MSKQRPPNDDLNKSQASAEIMQSFDAVEIERRRLANRLQDTVLSQVNLLLAQVNTYQQTIAATPQVHTAFSVLSTLLRQLMQDTRDLEASLHSAVLETLGLEAALESMANQQRRITGANISLSLQRLRERLPEPIELTLFRTAQDAVERAVRQGNASQVMITLERDDTAIRFVISDNGIQPVEEMLRHARYNINTLGGSLAIEANRYGGLDAIITFPITQPIILTDREMDVIELLVEGLSNKEMALRLDVRPRTIKFHLDNIYSKLGVTTRTEAAIYALQNKLERPS